MERIASITPPVKKYKTGYHLRKVSGYGAEGPWKDLPGQDPASQALSGLPGSATNQDERPTPMGVSVVDILAEPISPGNPCGHCTAGGSPGSPALVQVSMMEAILDFQFEVLTCHYNDGRQLPSQEPGKQWQRL